MLLKAIAKSTKNLFAIARKRDTLEELYNNNQEKKQRTDTKKSKEDLEQ